MEISELEKLLQGSTPGPWEANNFRVMAVQRDAKGEPIYELCQYICDTANNPATRTKENRTNAALIAAAPFLAAELLSLKQQNEWIPKASDPPKWGRYLVMIDSATEDGIPSRNVREAEFETRRRWSIPDGWDESDITHWRSLPSPPIATQVAGQGPSNAVTT